jgi:hypothetical protein
MAEILEIRRLYRMRWTKWQETVLGTVVSMQRRCAFAAW